MTPTRIICAAALTFACVIASAPAIARQVTTGIDVHALSQSGTIEPGGGTGGVKVHRRVRVAAHSRNRHRAENASTDRGCLTHDTRTILDAAERHFSTRFVLVSTCRPGAVIAGTRHVSQHRYGRAVDLKVPSTISKQAVVKWLYANAPGVTMTYVKMDHIHYDTGPFHKLACGGCGAPRKRIRYAHAH